MSSNSAEYSLALRRITESRAGWQGYAWLKTLLPSIRDEKEQRLLKAQFNLVAQQREWSFRSKMDVPIDARFAALREEVISSEAPMKPTRLEVTKNTTIYREVEAYTGPGVYVDRNFIRRRVQWNPETRKYDFIAQED